MGNLITKTYNKFQYEVSKAVSDPKADDYAKQQKVQETQDKAVAKLKKENENKKNEMEKERAEKLKASIELEKRSKFNPISHQIHNIAKSILVNGLILIFLGIAMYGGKISANQAIGYNIPFRILSFFYGMIFFFIVIPRAFIFRYAYGIKILNYTFIPLSIYVPEGWVERVFIGPYCYQEDENCIIEKNKVASLYKNGYDNSLKLAVAAAGLAATAAAAIAGTNAAKTTTPKEGEASEQKTPTPSLPSSSNPTAKTVTPPPPSPSSSSKPLPPSSPPSPSPSPKPPSPKPPSPKPPSPKPPPPKPPSPKPPTPTPSKAAAPKKGTSV